MDVEALCFAQGSAAPAPAPQRRALDEAIAALEVQMITAALEESGGNRSETARLLGIFAGGLAEEAGSPWPEVTLACVTTPPPPAARP